MNRMRSKTGLLALIIGVTATLLLTGYTLRSRPEAASTISASQNLTDQNVYAFTIRRPARSISETAERARLVAEMFTRQPLSAAAFSNALTAAGNDQGKWMKPFSVMPDLAVKYIPEFDELRLIDVKLNATTPNAESSASIGEENARGIMKRYFSELAERGVIRAADFNLDKVRVSYTRTGGGDIRSSERKSWIEEYRFTLLRQLNGIDFANAGITIGIHRSGGLSSLRLGGAEVQSVRRGLTEVPTGRGQMLERRVSGAAIEQRFKAQIPAGAQTNVIQEGVMYALPENAKEAVVEPLYLYSFTLSYEVEGQRVSSRRQTVGYSLTNPDASPVIFTAPSSSAADPQPQVPKRDR